MKTIHVYECDKCGQRFETKYEAYKHEAECYHMSISDYQDWMKAASAANRTYNRYIMYASPSNREKYNEAIQTLSKLEDKLKVSKEDRPSHFKEIN